MPLARGILLALTGGSRWGVEVICFADTRGSQVEIVQNIGRALRLNRDGTTKIARILVPVFLEPGEDPTDMVASASYKPLVGSSRACVLMMSAWSSSSPPAPSPASAKSTSGTTRTGGSSTPHGEGEDQEAGADAAAPSALLHFSNPRDAATIAAFLRPRVYRPESLVWLEGYQALLR